MLVRFWIVLLGLILLLTSHGVFGQQDTSRQPLQVVDDGDPEPDWVETSTLSENSKEYKNARAVALIRFPDGRWCTGSLLSFNTLITAAHCIPGAFQPHEVTFIFNLEKNVPEIGWETYQCPTLLGVWDEESYDVALLQCDPGPIDVPPDKRILPGKKLGFLSLSNEGIKEKQAIYIIHQNCVDDDKFTNEECSGYPPKMDTEGTKWKELTKKLSRGEVEEIRSIIHDADTLRGSSGAPVFSTKSHKVIGIHIGTSGSFNRATRVTDVPPIAQAGADQEVKQGAKVQLDGGRSIALFGPLKFSWKFLNRPSNSKAKLSKSNIPNPTFIADQPGDYLLELTVRDKNGKEAKDQVQVKAFANNPPIANAGPDQTVLVGSIVQLDGSGSSDPDGDKLICSWRFISKPRGSRASVSPRVIRDCTNPSSKPTFKVDKVGDYVLELRVSDGRGGTAIDQVKITAKTDITPPALITNFQASDNEDSKSTLTWTNPPDSDLYQVIVKRKTTGYPANHDDGETRLTIDSATPGRAETFVDTGLINGTTYYYAVFSRDQAGNWNDQVIAGNNADTGRPQAFAVIYVPDDYPTIQAAVNAAKPGDTIIVRDGTYAENVTVNKNQLTIQSENGADSTIVQAEIVVKARNVTIKGFTIKGSIYQGPPYTFGNLITDNTFLDGGVWLSYSDRNIISENTFIFTLPESGSIPPVGSGIALWQSHENTIVDNQMKVAEGEKVLGSYHGIQVNSSRNNFIMRNVISDAYEAITLEESRGNVVKDNTFIHCGIYVYQSYKNTIENNTVDGKPVLYFEDVADVVVSNVDAGQVILVNSQRMVVKNLNLTAPTVGITLLNVTDSKIMNNIISPEAFMLWALENGYIAAQHTVGILLEKSSNNEASENSIYYSIGRGIPPPPGWGGGTTRRGGISLRLATNNTIKNNLVSHSADGIWLDRSSENVVVGNELHSYHRWLVISYSSGNIIYLNNFKGKTDGPPYIEEASTIWNSPEPITYTYNDNNYTNYLGNYWGDYTGSDTNGDGIGDIPYSIDSDKDNYPLIKPFENYIISHTGPTTTETLLEVGNLWVANLPNPIRDVHTTTFKVTGEAALFVEEIRVRVFDLAGRLVWQGEAPSNELHWNTQDLLGHFLANGVYLYVITVRGYDGRVIRSEIKKLVILR